MERYFIVKSNSQARRLFPEPGREALRAACQEMLVDGPVIVCLKKTGHKRPRATYTVIRPENR